MLKDKADPTLRLCDATAIEQNMSMRRASEAAQDAQQRRLAASRRPDDADELVGHHREIRLCQRLQVAAGRDEGHLQFLRDENRLSHLY